MSEKEDRWPKGDRNGFFTGAEKGTPKYRMEMARKRVEAKEFKERNSAGSELGPIYRFKPRYSNYNPYATGSESNIEPAMKEEKETFVAALAGDLGPEMKAHANKYGLRGIAEIVEITPAGLIVRDLMDLLNAPEELFVRPKCDVSGLWELKSDWENPNADRRTKGEWRLEPIWAKGTRFVIRRNQDAMDIITEALHDALDALNEPDAKESADEWFERGDKIRAKLANKSWLLHEAGFEIRKAGEHGFVPMHKMPHGFDRDLKSVPILNAKDAFDLVNFEAHNLREILEYLVDAESKMAHGNWQICSSKQVWGSGTSSLSPESISTSKRRNSNADRKSVV